MYFKLKIESVGVRNLHMKSEIANKEKNYINKNCDHTSLNHCYFTGEIISDIDFRFVINSKIKSIVRFKLKLLNGTILDVECYDNIADYVYRHST